MNDRQMAVDARAREQRAREREARALAHQRTAAHKAREAPDAESAAVHQFEAEIHGRAARLQHQAIDAQVRHALAHESSPER